jgi:hypothetical protein
MRVRAISNICLFKQEFEKNYFIGFLHEHISFFLMHNKETVSFIFIF